MKVVIGNKELNLKGEDDSLISLSAEKVNYELMSLGLKNGEEADNTQLILVSLNLAEKLIKTERKMAESEKLIIDELNKMSGFVGKNFK